MPIRLKAFSQNCVAWFSLLLAFELVCGYSPAFSQYEQPFTLRVLTYNVHHGYGKDGVFDLERIAKVIRDSKADVVALQEVDQRTSGKPFPDYVAELAKLTELNGVFGRAQDYGGGIYGNGVLSRFPIEEDRVYEFEFSPGISPRSATFAKIRLPNGRAIGLLSAHFDHESSEDRIGQAQRVNQILSEHQGLPMVVAGDFNARPDSQPLEILTQLWTDTSKNNPLPTIPVNNPRARIDYILSAPDKSWETLESKVIQEKVASDHLPVLSVLRLKDLKLELAEKEFHFSPAPGIGPENGVMRRDPSDVIFAEGRYYVWYTKVTEDDPGYPEGHHGTVWFASSEDGRSWTEEGQALDRGAPGAWDDYGVYTPNISFSSETKKYYLYYTGVKVIGTRFSGGRIGVAVADAPDGGSIGWKRANEGRPVIRDPQGNDSRPDYLGFGSGHVDDAAAVFRDGKYWLYFKGSPGREQQSKLNLPRGTTPMGAAVSDRPDGDFTRVPLDERRGFLIEPGHEVLVWFLGEQLIALPTGHYRPPHDDDFRFHWSDDGIRFHPFGKVIESSRRNGNGSGLLAPGAFRPDVIDPKTTDRQLRWGISMTGYGRDEGLQRFDLK